MTNKIIQHFFKRKQSGLIATERLMGMLLVIISVQMFFDGIDRFLAS